MRKWQNICDGCRRAIFKKKENRRNFVSYKCKRSLEKKETLSSRTKKVRSDIMKKQILANKQFYVAMYLRLSKEDEDKDGISKTESNSIRNQRELIRTFIRENEDMELYDCYLDDGFSGSHYDRPEFQRMIKDIEAGKVNCVIVKDLSRFGRDYIETGRYLERIFPELGGAFYRPYGFL